MNTDDRGIAEARHQIEKERIANLAQKDKGNEVLQAMEATLQRLRDAKPVERDELARRYAVAITEYEKSLAFFKYYVVDEK